MSDSSANTEHHRDRGLPLMIAVRPANRVLKRCFVAASVLLVLLVGFPVAQAALGTDGGGGNMFAAPNSCASDRDVYRLDEPGKYTAFVRLSSTLASTEVRGSHGEVLATSDSSLANTAEVDLSTGVRFGVVPPPVFDVETTVLIQVQHFNEPYELVIVRLDESPEWSRLDVRPPVTSVINESGSCLIGDLWETLEIHTESVYSQSGVRQAFLVAPLARRP